MINKYIQMIRQKGLAKDTLTIYFYQFISLGISLIVNILIARQLGPEKKGLLDLFNLQTSLVMEFALLGFGSGALFYLAKKENTLPEVHGTSIVFCSIMGVVSIAVGFIAIPIWMILFDGLCKELVLLGFIISPLLLYKLISYNILIGIDKSPLNYRLGFISSIFYVVVIGVLYILGRFTYINLIFATVLQVLFLSIIYFMTIYKNNRSLSFNGMLIKKSLKYGMVIYIANILNVFQFKVDQIMVNSFLGKSQLGIYNVSVRWAEMLFLLDGAIIGAALYKISSSSEQDSFNLTNRILKVQAIISVAGGIILAVCAYPLVSILYGKEFIGAAAPMILLIPGIICWSISKLFSGMLIYNSQKAIYCMIATLVGLVLNVMLNLIFVYLELGIVGIAISSSISYTVTAILIYVRFKRIGKNEKNNDIS